IEPIRALGYGRTMTKRGPSAFFDTGLATVLRKDGVDTVLLAGAVTSGCVRATAVDAMSHGFAVVVVADGVVDRSPTSHAVALFEMSMKYAAVAAADDIAAVLSATLAA
ncbi:MAG: isochorismatase family protein, partial [Microbacterium sp.]